MKNGLQNTEILNGSLSGRYIFIRCVYNTNNLNLCEIMVWIRLWQIAWVAQSVLKCRYKLKECNFFGEFPLKQECILTWVV